MTSLARRTDRGAAAVEFALVVRLLLSAAAGCDHRRILLQQRPRSHQRRPGGLAIRGIGRRLRLDAAGRVHGSRRLGVGHECDAAGPGHAVRRPGPAVQDLRAAHPGSVHRRSVSFQCSTAGGPTLTSADLPAVPTGTVGTCFVRVVAARPYTITVAMQKWTGPGEDRHRPLRAQDTLPLRRAASVGVRCRSRRRGARCPGDHRRGVVPCCRPRPWCWTSAWSAGCSTSGLVADTRP